MTETNSPTVHDDPRKSRLVFEQDGAEAELLYRRDGNRLLLTHTGVPDQLGGRGIGGQLVRAALDRAAAEGLTVIPWCPYARKWIEDHPDAAARVTVDWESPREG
jgi:predicted GNAT family acetyltransferase